MISPLFFEHKIFLVVPFVLVFIKTRIQLWTFFDPVVDGLGCERVLKSHLLRFVCASSHISCSQQTKSFYSKGPTSKSGDRLRRVGGDKRRIGKVGVG